ncbi:uncharacterized protein [Venturia canescens]|uniref:uncharacterized protein n=1 Tax=Venturia canescens TaxID=32260 RepID=UPI001C9CECF4|nr:uncharacterized protein LOC122413923 [Venturia canescens]
MQKIPSPSTGEEDGACVPSRVIVVAEDPAMVDLGWCARVHHLENKRVEKVARAVGGRSGGAERGGGDVGAFVSRRRRRMTVSERRALANDGTFDGRPIRRTRDHIPSRSHARLRSEGIERREATIIITGQRGGKRVCVWVVRVECVYCSVADPSAVINKTEKSFFGGVVREKSEKAGKNIPNK